MGLNLEGVCETCAFKSRCLDSYNEAFSKKFSGKLIVSVCEFYRKKKEGEKDES